MARARVSSFMSHFSHRLQYSTSSGPNGQPRDKMEADSVASSSHLFSTPPVRETPTPSALPRTRSGRSASAAAAMPYAHHHDSSSSLDTAKGTPPELMPIFSFLNSHANKLYQEGYFLKLNDLDNAGRPNTDRNWTECFAQLVGTVLSIWDAAALDAAGQHGEVAPAFINLADASIKMIETLPTRDAELQPVQNVLSVSTAGKNRYLLHFNSFHSLTQWTAGIRLATFEHTSLQELYTGSLVAGKGKTLNNIRTIMERSRFRIEDWARVRFGAGTPWRRCWYVIEPPNEKDFQKSVKKRSAYERPSLPKGEVKFYETKKTKKVTPIATITDAYAAYAVYPQSKPLIDQSTLVKVEGQITIHSNPESKTEGFVFVMPESHAAVSGFEMMLRWLFPVYDTFGLYGRPTRLVADTIDSRGLMFAMPTERRYGYLDLQDVTALVCQDGSPSWSEQHWRKQLKDATARRLTHGFSNRPPTVRGSMRSSKRASLPVHSAPDYQDHRPRDGPPTRPSLDLAVQHATNGAGGSLNSSTYHARSASDTFAPSGPPSHRPEQQPPRRAPSTGRRKLTRPDRTTDASLSPPQESPDPAPAPATAMSDVDEVGSELRPQPAPTPVAEPPAFLHSPGQTPQMRPAASPELRRANSRMSVTTLNQLVDASKSGNQPNGSLAAAGAATAWKSSEGLGIPERYTRGVHEPNGVAGGDHADDRPSPSGSAMNSRPAGEDVGRPSPSAPAPAPSSWSASPPRSNSEQTVPRKSLPARS